MFCKFIVSIFITLVLSFNSIDGDFQMGLGDLRKALNKCFIEANKTRTTKTPAPKTLSKGEQCLKDEKCVQLGEKILLFESNVRISN